jgi:hypothetical protein
MSSVDGSHGIDGHFQRLTEVLLPVGGTIVALVEGYFDESGDLKTGDRIFCISGYFIETEQARQMDRDWRAVLAKYNLDFFHMVDCAHGVDGFQHLKLAERIAVVTDLISLIKRYTLEGFSVFAVGDAYEASGAPDVYSDCASNCVKALELFLQERRQEGKIAYFFENGHASAGTAYNHMAKKIQRSSDSLTFSSKQEIPLLQAADLLAWQSCKYAKDYFYPASNNREPRRAPRKDFLSLMEHRHTFMHMHIKDGQKSAAIELWPLSMRAQSSVGLQIEDEGPIIYWRQDGDATPIIPVEKPLGWRPIGGRMVYVAFDGMKNKPFALCFDDQRLLETIYTLIGVASEYGESVPPFPTEGATIERIDDGAVIRIKLPNSGSIAFQIPPDVLSALREYLSKT